MTFQDHLKSYAKMTTDYLQSRFSEQKSVPAHLHEAMRYAVLNGGKRFRPFLVIESASLFGIPAEQALPTAAALECLHSYSLVHDDLPAMDDDDMRRGKPTTHIAFDEATAILAGDGLLTYAFEILGEHQTHPDPSIRSALILELAKAAGWKGMVGGQALDLSAEGNNSLSLDEVARIQSLKTGAIIRFACKAGGLLGGADNDQLYALEQYGELLGRAFQIADDLLDVEGSAETVGKSTAKDHKAGKATFVSLMGIEEARSELCSLKEKAVTYLEPFGNKADRLIDAAHFAAERSH